MAVEAARERAARYRSTVRRMESMRGEAGDKWTDKMVVHYTRMAEEADTAADLAETGGSW